jgi:FkbM family methyltransferase
MGNIILEIGVNTGQDVERLLQYRGDYHGFEPVPELYNKLTERYKNNYRVNLYPYAVDIEEGPATFNISKPTGIAYAYGCSSLHEFSTNLDEVWPGREDFEVVEKITVERIRLESFLDNLNYDKISYFWCDAQGNDLNVLKSMGDHVKNIQEGRMEVAYKVELYSGTGNTHANAMKFLEEHGFKYRIHKPNHECDIIFWR